MYAILPQEGQCQSLGIEEHPPAQTLCDAAASILEQLRGVFAPQRRQPDRHGRDLQTKTSDTR